MTALPNDAEIARLGELASDVQKAVEALPDDDRKAYLDAKQSVVDARRSAETHEGLLQVN